MNKIKTAIAVSFIGIAMAIGVGLGISKNSEVVQSNAMSNTYTVGSTRKSSVANGDLVAWGTSSSTLAYTIDNDWVKCNTTKANWIIFQVETTTGGFYLKDYSDTTKYVYSSAAKKVSFSTTDKTVLSLSTNNATKDYVYGGSGIGNYTFNSSGIRPYSLSNYTAAYLYPVSVSKDLSGITITGTPSTFYVGYAFNTTGMTVTANYSDSSSENVTASCSFTGYDMSTPGNQTVTASFTYGGTNKTATYDITVLDRSLSSIAVQTAPTKTTTYIEGDCFDPTGLIITTVWSAGDNGTVAYADESANFTFSPTTSTALTTSNTSVTITYGGKSTTQAITVTLVAKFKRITSASSLVAGAKYVIGTKVSGTASAKFLSSTQNANNRDAIFATVTNDVVTYKSGMEVLTLGGSTGEWTLYANNSETKGYLYAASSSYNYLRTQATNNKNGEWTIVFDNSGVPTLTAQGTNTNNLLKNNNNLFSCYGSGQTAVALYRIQLTSVTTTNQTASFTAGNTFSYGGTLTGHYANETRTVTPTSYHLDSEDGAEITASTVLTKAAHDGHKIYVVYTEEGITKSCFYTITINYAAVTSVVINTHSAKIAPGQSYSVSSVAVTVNSQYANPEYEWVVASKTDADDATFTSPTLSAGEVEGTVVLRCRSKADNTKYDDLEVSISSDPLAHVHYEMADVTNGSVSVYSDAGIISFTASQENFGGVISYSWSTSNSAAVSIDNHQDEATCDFNVEGSGSARLSCNIVGSTKGNLTVFVDVTVDATYVTSVTWTTPTINVFTGASLTASDVSAWNVKYNTNSGKTNQTPENFDIKLGGSNIALPYAWQLGDHGKTLCVEYGGVSSETTTVAVTQTINSISLDNYNEPTTYVFTNKSWAATSGGSAANWTSGLDGDGYNDNGVQILDGHNGTDPYATSPVSFTDVAKIVVTYHTNKSAGSGTISVKVGSNAKRTNNVGFSGEADGRYAHFTTEFNYSEKQTGSIVLSGVTNVRSIYIESIAIYTLASTTPIGNEIEHAAAQRAAVRFAMRFNSAMDTTSNCSTNMSTAWANATKAYTNPDWEANSEEKGFIEEIESLSSAEQTYAKNLLKYVKAKYTAGTDTNYAYCIERAMMTYEICVNKHGQTAFMSSVRPVSARNEISLFEYNSTSLIAVISSLIGLTVIGGFLLIKRRKEQ